jgi:hypothetical protein
VLRMAQATGRHVAGTTVYSSTCEDQLMESQPHTQQVYTSGDSGICQIQITAAELPAWCVATAAAGLVGHAAQLTHSDKRRFCGVWRKSGGRLVH